MSKELDDRIKACEQEVLDFLDKCEDVTSVSDFLARIDDVCVGLAEALSQKLAEVDDELARAQEPKRAAELAEERLAIALRLADVGGRRQAKRAGSRPAAEKGETSAAAEDAD